MRYNDDILNSDGKSSGVVRRTQVDEDEMAVSVLSLVEDEEVEFSGYQGTNKNYYELYTDNKLDHRFPEDELKEFTTTGMYYYSKASIKSLGYTLRSENKSGLTGKTYVYKRSKSDQYRGSIVRKLQYIETNNYNKLTYEQKIFIATIYGETSICSDKAGVAVANVIMNRVGKYDWKQYTTVEQIIKYTGFDAFSHSTTNFQSTMNYLNQRENGNISKNRDIETLIELCMPVYNKKVSDITNGAVSYYSPKAQAQLAQQNPSMYKKIPEVEYDTRMEAVTVKGCEKDDLKFFRFKVR